MTTVAQFQIEFTRILDENGQIVGEIPDSLTAADEVLAVYRLMVRTRVFDAKAIALQRTGQLGTYFREPSGFRLQITNEDSATFAEHAND